MRFRSSATLAAVILFGSGCAQTFDATRLGVPVTMSSAPGAAPEGTRFTLNSHSTFALWGIATVSKPSLQKALASQLGNGTGVADLKIRTRSRFWDVFVTVISAGIIIPRTVTFEGVVTGVAPAASSTPATAAPPSH